MPGRMQDAARYVGRTYDDVVDSIRGLLGYDAPGAPRPTSYDPTPVRGKPGGATRAAVEAQDAARARRAAQARSIGLVDENPAAAAVNDTFNARDASGPILAAGGALAGAGLVGTVADNVMRPKPVAQPKPGDMDSTGGTAELASESRPVPAVTADDGAEQAFTNKFKRQYTARENKREASGEGGYDPRQQAQALIAQLNQKRMAAGAEVPEAPQMMAQINDLLGKANNMANARAPAQSQQRATATPGDPHAQAQLLLAQLNEMRRQAGGEVPQARQIMAEVSRLQAMGDQQRNAQTTARR